MTENYDVGADIVLLVAIACVATFVGYWTHWSFGVLLVGITFAAEWAWYRWRQTTNRNFEIMRVETTGSFGAIYHPSYPQGEKRRLIQQSSAVGEYPDSFDKPGSSYLWIGDQHHLDREEVREMGRHLLNWLDTGSL